MNKWLLLALFCMVACIQIAVPAAMILKREWTLAHGAQFKFETAPLDPYDAYRGRYVALNVKERTAPNPEHVHYSRMEQVYVSVEEGPDGFAQLTGVSKDAPATGAYIRAHVRRESSDSSVEVTYPFDRYYLEEGLAPEAERLLREELLNRLNSSYVTIRVHEGFAVLEEVYMQDTPIVEYVRERLRDAEQ